jgi:MFS family permease
MVFMPQTEPANNSVTSPSPSQVERAISLSYKQVMLGAIFGASTGGMFLIGFAMRLGHELPLPLMYVLLGLMTTVPAYFVVFQFPAAYLIERGISRRKLTIIFSFVSPLCWVLIAAIPFFENVLTPLQRVWLLIAIIAVVTLAAQIAGNARGSWLGELIPESRRGRFFGNCSMFAAIIASVFAVAEGAFLDQVKSMGLLAFAALFFFGVVFGLGSASLHIPQPDCPLPHKGHEVSFWTHVRNVFRNRAFVMLAIVHGMIAMGNIAGPFGTAYLLDDVKVSFLGLGLLNTAATAAVLLTSPLWGKIIDRVGCRPVLVLCLGIMAPCSVVWYFIPPGVTHRAYMLLPFSNFICAAAAARMSVTLTTLMYKLSTPHGRSVQFATYGVFITLVSAPMPLVGGWLVGYLKSIGWSVDLRVTCYLWSLFIGAAMVLACRLKEKGSILTRSLVLGYIPSRLDRVVRYAIGGLGAAVGIAPGPAADEEEPE